MTRIAYGLLSLFLLIIVIGIWQVLLPKRDSEIALRHQQNAVLEQREQMSDGETTFRREWSKLAKEVAGLYRKGNAPEVSAICREGRGVSAWRKEYYFACMGIAAGSVNMCSKLPAYVATQDVDAVPEAHMNCIQQVMKFAKDRPPKTACEPLREYYSTRPDVYIACRSWVDMSGDNCLIIGGAAKIKTDFEQNHRVIRCLTNLAWYSRSKRHCGAATKFAQANAAYIDHATVSGLLSNCPARF